MGTVLCQKIKHILLGRIVVQCKSISKEIISFTSRNMVPSMYLEHSTEALCSKGEQVRSIAVIFIYSFLLFNKHLLSYYYVL